MNTLFRRSRSTAIVMGVVIFLFSGGYNSLAGSSEDERLTWGKRVEYTMNSGDPSLLDQSIDIDAIIDKAVNEFKTSEAHKNGFRAGVKDRWKKASFGTQILAFMKNSGSYKLLRVDRVGKKDRALFRLLTEEGAVNYHGMMLEHTQHGLKVADVYTVSNGELMSDTFRRAFLPVAHDANKGIVGRLLGWENDFVKNLPKIQEMQTLAAQGKFVEAMRAYHDLPGTVKNEKMLLLLRVRYAPSVSDKEYNDAMKAFQKAFPGDPALDLLMIDSYVLDKKYAEAIQSINRLDKSLGGDPYLHTLRANMYFADGKFGPAKESAKKAIAEEPELLAGYWTLVTIALAEKNFHETARLLTVIENERGVVLTDLKDIDVYQEFIAAPEYRNWMKSRRKK